MLKQILIVWLLLASIAQSAEFGSLGGSYIGPFHSQIANFIDNSATTLTFTAANTGWCARFMATDTRDVLSVGVNFSAATTPGTATLRIETVDGTTGKPTGTLYDAAATKQFTPAVGWNVVTFDTPPSTGMTAGTMYAAVLLKDDAGTTCTLRARIGESEGGLPSSCLTASDGSTRSNFAEVSQAQPICYFAMEGGAIESLGCCPGATVGSFLLSGSTKVGALKVVLPTQVVVRGIRFCGNAGIARGGTPPNDLRVRILDSSHTAVANTTVTIDKDYLTGVTGRGLYIPLPSVTLPAGTYRVAFDSSGGDGSNYFSLNYLVLADNSLQSSAFAYSESTDSGANFTDYDTRQLPLGLELDSISASSSRTPIPNLNGNMQ